MHIQLLLFLVTCFYPVTCHKNGMTYRDCQLSDWASDHSIPWLCCPVATSQTPAPLVLQCFLLQGMHLRNNQLSQWSCWKRDLSLTFWQLLQPKRPGKKGLSYKTLELVLNMVIIIYINIPQWSNRIAYWMCNTKCRRLFMIIQRLLHHCDPCKRWNKQDLTSCWYEQPSYRI